MRMRVFLQFALILCVITAAVIAVVRPVFFHIIERELTSEMTSAFSEIEDAYNGGGDISNIVRSIEIRDDVILEIYEKSESGKYDNFVFCQTIYSTYKGSSDHNYMRSPILGFSQNEFVVNDSFDDTTKVGSMINSRNNNKFFTVCKQSADGKYLFVSAVNYSVFEKQVDILFKAVFLIIFILLIIIIFTLYLYVTKITAPIKKMTDETLEMASTQNDKLRVSTRKKQTYFTEIDSLIAGINNLYQSLISTKNALIKELDEKEKSEKFKNDMLSAISHELKTPVTIIRGYAEGLAFVADDKQALNEYAETITEECERLNNLVLNMLTFLKLRHNSFVVKSHRFCISDFLDRQIKLYENVFKSNGITFVNEIDDVLYGFADDELMKYVINNIISNAVSYIGGDRKIKLRYEETDGYYRIFVFNSGKGIDPENIDRLWESFYREDSSRLQIDGHFGMGLSIIKGVQDAHGCECGGHNTDGGVEFWFDIVKATV